MRSLPIWHRRIGLLAATFIVLATVSGLLRAFAPLLYWEPGYKEKKGEAAQPSGLNLDSVQVGLPDLFNAVARSCGPGAEIVQVTLERDFGLTLFRVFLRSEDGLRRVTVDARSREVLTPLGQDRAIAAASQYVNGAAPVVTVQEITAFSPRLGSHPQPVYRVIFGNTNRTEIFVHRDTGEIVEELDHKRRLAFLVADLHELNFFGVHRKLLAVSGAFILAVVGTGLWYYSSLRRRERNRQRSYGT